jgi:deoxyribodipyrimidine photo-lyase
MAPPNLLIYLLRRDLRLEDNPVFHAVANDAAKTYTHLLPVYIFPAQQIEVSGFIPQGSEEKSPYPEARSGIGKFWRCGPHRAKFIAESVWELKEALGNVGSGLEVRVGMLGGVLEDLLAGFKGDEEGVNVGAVWMTAEEGVEEKVEEKDCEKICKATGVEFKLWKDEKYFIDEYVRPSYHVFAK